MLDAIGAGSVDDLFADIAVRHRNPSLNLPAGLTELEVSSVMQALANQNLTVDRVPSFLGAGAYHHFIPSAVWQIASRSEFYTAYTPYQPEVSQGTLQAAYEFQSFIALLTGMDAANASVYDGASALAEAALMAVRHTHRTRIAVAASIHPDYLATLKTYLEPQGVGVDTFDAKSPPSAGGYACLAVQQPCFEGYLEPVEGVAAAAHAGGALFVVSVDPLTLGLLKPPGEYGADIVVGEAQSLGVPLSFGGPYCGIFACSERLIRQMPGRIVGKTTDANGRTGYVLTLQAREQHIRRERATSNICTSESLIALAVTIHLALLGKEGVRQAANLCYQKAHYLAAEITKLTGFRLSRPDPFFYEFAVECPVPPAELNARLLEQGIIGGLDVSDRVPNGWLLCATEMTRREDIDRLVKEVRVAAGQ